MNKSIWIWIFIFALFPNYLFNKELADTSKVHQTSAINVTAKRIISEPAFQYSAYTIFDRQKIEQTGAMQISEVLIYSPGVFVRNYGGLGGMKTVSMRGTASSQTTVMLDGLPISSTQNSSFDFSNFPIGIVDKIEIIRGGQSAVVGNSAIGGVVNILTDIKDTDRLFASVKHTSINETQIKSNIAFQIDQSKFSVFSEYSKTNGQYPFEFTQFGKTQTIKRKNADFENMSISVHNHSRIDKIEIKSFLIANKSERGVPSAVLQGRIESKNARLNFEELIAKSSIAVDYVAYSLKSDAMLKIAEILYKDTDSPLHGSVGEYSRFTSRDFVWQSYVDFSGESYYSKISAAINYNDLKGNMLDPKADGQVHRFNPNISLYSEKSFNYKSLKYTLLSSIRADYFSENEFAVSPLFACNIAYNSLPIIIKTQISNNFRMPNFNEMYYLNYGTSDLKPEKSMSYSIGLTSLLFNNIFIDINSYFIETKDQIIAIPKSPISWSAENIEKVRQKGIEISISSSIEQIYLEKISVAWTLQDSRNYTSESPFYKKILPLMPQEVISGSLMFDLSYVYLTSDFYYSSFRYIQADNNSYFIMPNYFTMNMRVSLPISVYKSKLVLKIEVNNLTDKRYAIINNYPLPGRHFLFGINYDLKYK